MVVGGAALVFIISLAWPPIEAGESDEDIAEWKKQQEEEKRIKSRQLLMMIKIMILQTRKERL